MLLASYPKSGNTWLRAFLASAMANGAPVDINANPGGTIAGADRACFDTALGLDSVAMAPSAIAPVRHRVWSETDDRTAPIWLKVHDAWLPFAAGCPRPYAAVDIGAVIHVVRDPRDVAISFAHHFDMSIDEAIDWMGDDQAMLDVDPTVSAQLLPQLLSSWSAHVSSWKDTRELPVLTLRYEDMHAAPAETFGRIAQQAGLVAGPTIERAIEQSRFSRLQSQEASRGFAEAESRHARFFRQGRAGLWEDILSPRQQAAIVDRHGDVMAQLGYRT